MQKLFGNSRSSSVRILAAISLLPSFAYAHTNGSSYTPRPYTIDVDPDFVNQTILKAAKFYPTVDIDQPAWTDGPPSLNVSEIARYWAEEYDWFSYQDELNANFTHYITTIPAPGGTYNHDLDVHFVHQRSEREDVIPLLMLHGWPSTHVEWAKVIPGLVDPPNDSQPAFHVVAPDLPGYGFSPAPVAPGLGPSEHATVFVSLMKQLGYDRYAVYSTDLGYVVALRIVAEHQEKVISHSSDFYIVFPNATDIARYASNQTTPEETRYISSVNYLLTYHSAYASIHSTLPLSLTYALNDSPVGFAAWMWQLAHTVRDGSVPLSLRELVTQAFLLYIPGVYGNIRSYKELYSPTFFTGELTTVPTIITSGVISTEESIRFLGISTMWDWVERTANVTYFNRQPVGAHFPAVDQPELWLDVIREAYSAEA